MTSAHPGSTPRPAISRAALRAAVAGTLLLGSGLQLGVAIPSAAAQESQVESDATEVRRNVGEPVSVAALEAILFELESGRSLAPERLLDALMSGRAPLVRALLDEFAQSPSQWRPAGSRRLETGRRATIRAALEGIPARVERLVAESAQLDVDAELRAREIALAVLGGTGSSSSVDALLALATPTQEAASVPRALMRAYESALTALLARAPAARERVRSRFESIPESLRPGTVQALGSVADQKTLDILADLLDREQFSWSPHGFPCGSRGVASNLVFGGHAPRRAAGPKVIIPPAPAQPDAA